MDLSPQLIIGSILVVWNGFLTFLLFKQKNSIHRILRGGKRESITEMLADTLDNEKKLGRALADTNKKVEGLLFSSQFYIQRIGLVRFNPFNNTGGDQSFILALVDKRDSGVVISGLHTRNGTRWYAKKIQNGQGVEHALSDDELRAIKSASVSIKKYIRK